MNLFSQGRHMSFFRKPAVPQAEKPHPSFVSSLAPKAMEETKDEIVSEKPVVFTEEGFLFTGVDDADMADVESDGLSILGHRETVNMMAQMSESDGDDVMEMMTTTTTTTVMI